LTGDITTLEIQPDARRRIESLSAHLTERGVRAFLVGGVVRDALVGRPVDDFDIAIPAGSMRAVAGWAAAQGRYAISLHETPPTRRVTFDDGMVVDAACFRGASLEEDLRLRDFTVNAMATPLEAVSGDLSGRLIDPCGGREDLRRRRLRQCSPRSLGDDPLRMLRAFRFMATHGLRVEEATLWAIRERAPEVTAVAWERIREEFFKLLAAPRSYPALRAMDGAGLLDALLPEIAPMKGAPQNQFHHLDVWEHTLDALDRFERDPVPAPLRALGGSMAEYLAENGGQGVPMVALLKFALLLHDVAKPATRSVDASGRVRFIGHEKEGAEIARQVSGRFMMSKRARATVVLLVAEHLRTMHLSSGGPPSPRALRRFMRRVGEHWMGVVAHSWADMEASRGPARTEKQRVRTARTLVSIAEFCGDDEAAAETRAPLITGGDIVRVFGVAPGPVVGRLLRRVDEAWTDGEITTPEQATEYVRALLRQDAV
jgi:poly(A) polymerase